MRDRAKSTSSKNLVGFSLAGGSYAFRIERVVEIIHPLPLFALPSAPRSLVGVADHRRQVVPVVDLRILFDLPGRVPTERVKWVVVRTSSRVVGLVVDSVSEVFGSTERRSIPDQGLGKVGPAIEEAVVHDGKLVFVLSAGYVAREAARFDLSGAASALSEGAQRGTD